MIDARELSTRKINAELRWLLYEQGVKEDDPQPERAPLARRGILTRCKITFEGSLGYFGCGLIDGAEVQVNGRGLVGRREHDVGRRRDRVERRLAGRRRAARRRPGRQGPGRGAHGHRPEGRHDHRARRRRLDDRLHDAARAPDHLRRRGPRARRLDVRRHDLRGRQGRRARDRLRRGRVDRRRHRADRAQVLDLRARHAARASRSSSAARSSTTTTASSRARSWCCDGRRDERTLAADGPRRSRSSRRRSSTTST